MKIDCGLCDKTFDDGLREIACPHNLLPYSTEVSSGIFDIPKVTQEPKFEVKPIPGREFSDWPIDEEILARSIYEDGKGYPNASFLPMPEIPITAAECLKNMNAAIDRLSGSKPSWEFPKVGGFPFGAMEFRESDRVPKGEMWLVDRIGVVHKIINIGNALHDADAISLCIGEHK